VRRAAVGTLGVGTFATLGALGVDLLRRRTLECGLDLFGSLATHARVQHGEQHDADRKSTRLNSSHVKSSYAVFCLKKKKKLKGCASLTNNRHLSIIATT